MNEWCIHGWRQQSTDREQILAWLAEAKQLGFERYNLYRQDQCYWLCCASTERIDIAAAVRSQVQEPAAVVVQLWAQRLVVVAWREQTLLGCCEFSADPYGLQSFCYVAEQWLDPAQMNCVLVIAGSATRRLLDNCEHAKDARNVADLTLDNTRKQPYLKQARMRSLRQSPPWLRRRIVVRVVSVSAAMASIFVWWLWPSPTPLAMQPLATNAVPQSSPQAVIPVGRHPQQLSHVNELLRQVSFLAGWQVKQWQLDEHGERLQLQKSYGTEADLLAQIPAFNWQLTNSRSGFALLRELPQEPPQKLPDAITANNHTSLQPDLNGYEQQLRREGFKLSSHDSYRELTHSAFDPYREASWQAVLDWLSAQPKIRITSAMATPQHLSWQFTLTVTSPHKE